MVKADKQLERIISYILCYMIGLSMIYMPAILVLLVFMCERGAAESASCRSYLQTIGIVVLVMLASITGSSGAYLFYMHGIFISFAYTLVSLVFAGTVWRCCWHG